MAESKADIGRALLRVLGSSITLPLVGATPEDRAAAQGEAEYAAGMRLTRPESKSDDAEHERRMVAFTAQKLRERADHEEAEGLGAEAERLRTIAARHEATLKLRDRTGKAER